MKRALTVWRGSFGRPPIWSDSLPEASGATFAILCGCFIPVMCAVLMRGCADDPVSEIVAAISIQPVVIEHADSVPVPVVSAVPDESADDGSTGSPITADETPVHAADTQIVEITESQTLAGPSSSSLLKWKLTLSTPDSQADLVAMLLAANIRGIDVSRGDRRIRIPIKKGASVEVRIEPFTGIVTFSDQTRDMIKQFLATRGYAAAVFDFKCGDDNHDMIAALARAYCERNGIAGQIALVRLRVVKRSGQWSLEVVGVDLK